jgi:uncharacterized membrane protein
MKEVRMQHTSMSKTNRVVGIAIFIAIIVVLQFVAAFIKIGPFSITLVMVPIVVGAALYGAAAGAVLGAAFGVVVLINCISGVDPGGHMLWAANPPLTAVLCLVKGMAAGYAAGLVYAAVAKFKTYGAVITAALTGPVVNTGIFILAMIFFYREMLVLWAGESHYLYFAIIGLTGFNFLLEIGLNIVLSPSIMRVIRAVRKPAE